MGSVEMLFVGYGAFAFKLQDLVGARWANRHLEATVTVTAFSRFDLKIVTPTCSAPTDFAVQCLFAKPKKVEPIAESVTVEPSEKQPDAPQPAESIGDGASAES